MEKFAADMTRYARIGWLLLLVSVPLDLLAPPGPPGSAWYNPAILIAGAFILHSRDLQLHILNTLRQVQKAALEGKNTKLILVCGGALIVLAFIELLLTVSKLSPGSVIIGLWVFIAAAFTVREQIKYRAVNQRHGPDLETIWKRRLLIQHLGLILLPSILIRIASFSLSADPALSHAGYSGTYFTVPLSMLLMCLTQPAHDWIQGNCLRCCAKTPLAFCDQKGCDLCAALFIERRGLKAERKAPVVFRPAGIPPGAIGRPEKTASIALRELQRRWRQAAGALFGVPAPSKAPAKSQKQVVAAVRPYSHHRPTR